MNEAFHNYFVNSKVPHHESITMCKHKAKRAQYSKVLSQSKVQFFSSSSFLFKDALHFNPTF